MSNLNSTVSCLEGGHKDYTASPKVENTLRALLTYMQAHYGELPGHTDSMGRPLNTITRAHYPTQAAVSHIRVDDGDREEYVVTLSCGHKLVLPVTVSHEGHFGCETCKAAKR